MKQCLSLSRAAVECKRRAIVSDLRYMTPDSAPAFYLSVVINTAAAKVVAAIPLKPAPRVFHVDPAFFSPDR